MIGELFRRLAFECFLAVALEGMVVGDAPDALGAFALSPSWLELVFVFGGGAEKVEALESPQLFGAPIDAFFLIGRI